MIPLVSSLLPIVGEVLDRVVPDKAGNEKAKRDLERTLAQAAVKGQLGQLEINKVEAAHRSVFVAGWRPCVGWVCAFALAFHFIVAPVVEWAGALWGFHLPVPSFDMDSLLFVLGSLLGIGSLRTLEKTKGLTK
jgi:hypothetical protein